VTVEEGKAELAELRELRVGCREELDAHDARRRVVLRELLAAGVSQAELARWEGVTDWAISQAVHKAEVSATPPG
jgi:hypothetical protein